MILLPLLGCLSKPESVGYLPLKSECLNNSFWGSPLLDVLDRGITLKSVYQRGPCFLTNPATTLTARGLAAGSQAVPLGGIYEIYRTCKDINTYFYISFHTC